MLSDEQFEKRQVFKIHIHRTEITDKGAIMFMNRVKHLPSLTFINMTWTNLAPETKKNIQATVSDINQKRSPSTMLTVQIDSQ